MLESCKKEIPFLGVGVSLNPLWLEGIMSEITQAVPMIDWVEIYPENYLDRKMTHSACPSALKSLDATLGELALKGLPLVPHGDWLSVGDTDALDENYMKRLKRLLQCIQAPWFSDHLCFSSVDHVSLLGFMPLPRTSEVVRHIVPRIRAIQNYMALPFLVEPFFSYAREGSQELTEAQFIAEIVEQADCGLLLDAKVVHANTHRQRLDPVAFLAEIPLDRVVEVHMAGYRYSTPEADRKLHGVLREILIRTRPCGVLLEHVETVPADFQEVMDVTAEVRRVMNPLNCKEKAA